MKKTLFCLPLLLLLAFNTYAQGYYNKWPLRFGSFLDFNTGKAVYNESIANPSEFFIYSGNSSISDANGNLLFYTDGLAAINAKHTFMPNADSANSNTSNSQKSLIIPHVNNNNQYYLFTVGVGGFYYSIVDMTLDNGLGDVLTPTPINDSIVGLFTAIRMPNNKDYWVIGHNRSNAFYAYRLTAAGLDPSPVISYVGIVLNWNTSGAGSGHCYLKPSPQGDKLAMTIAENSTCEIYDFDKTTGTVSNPVTLPSNYLAAYGVEFSPDGSKLYLSGGGRDIFTGTATPAYIYQINMQAGNATAIINSATLVATPSSFNHQMGALQRGPDCKIYAAKEDTCYLGIIHNPNALGLACNYVDNELFLPVNSALPHDPNKPPIKHRGSRDLPNFFEMTCTAPIAVNLGQDQLLCAGQTLTLNAGTAQSYLWSTGATNSSIAVATSGTYWVKVGNGTFYGTDTIKVVFNPMPQVNLGKDTIICQDFYLQLDAGIANTYLWSTGATTASITVSTTGSYWVKSSNGPCEASDSIKVKECEIITDIEFPNVFTPNKDNHNNVFKPIKYSGIAQSTLEIYNRWGNKVYSTRNPIQGWDGAYNGKSCAEGVYYWSLQYTSFLNESKILKGFVTLLK